MNKIEELSNRVNQFIKEEKNMWQRLDDLENAAVAAEADSAPELTRILLLHADMILGMLEQSRRRWMRLSVALSIALVGCLVLFALAIR